MKKKPLILTAAAASAFSMTLGAAPVYAASPYQADLDRFASHQASLMENLEELYLQLDETEDTDRTIELHAAIVAAIESHLATDDAALASANQEVKQLNRLFQPLLFSLSYVHGYTLDLLQEEIDEETFDALTEKEIAYMEHVDASFEEAANRYKQTHRVLFSEDMLSLLDEGVEETTYTVKRGDTLYSIAREHGMTVGDLKAWNGLSSDRLAIGQVLKLPLVEEEEGPELDAYTVVRGDTLYGLSKRFGVSVAELKRMNGLSSDALKVGQKLTLRLQQQKTYTVVRGDTLYGIAKAHNTTVASLKEWNGLSTDGLKPGQVLYIR